MKISKTTANTVIGYKKDFDIKDPTLEKKQFRIRVPNSHDEYVEVIMVDGESTELMMESFEKLDEIRNQVATVWAARERFHQLGTILTDDAKEAYDEIVADDYPNNADKTHAHYEELKKQIITKLSDHVNPGDKVCTYLESKVKYEWCKDDDGNLVKPLVHFKRCKTLRKLGGLMHHTHQGTYFDDNRFKTCVWNHFPQEWQDWMTEEQQRDPFDVNNPLTTEEMIDKFQHLWNLKIRPQVKANKGRGKRKKDDDDDNDDADDKKNSNQGSRRRFKKGGNNNKQGGGGNSSSRTNCKIDGHEKYRHDWKGCYLNPYNAKCDHEAAKKYYDEKARGNMAWYRDMYEAYQNKSNHGGGHTDGQGRGYQGRGSYRGRGYSGRGGGRGYNNGGRGGRGGRGYYNQGNYHNNQGGGNQQGSGNSDGYFNHQNGGYEQGYQQGPPQQQQSYHFGMTPGTQMRPQAPNVPQGPSSSSQGNYSYQRG